MAGALVSCQPDEFDSPREAGVPQATSYEDLVTVSVDQTTNQVTFSLNASGCYPIWIIDGTTYSTVNGLQKIYATAGDKEVEVKIGNANGISDGSFVKTFHIDNTIFDFSGYVTRLAGNETKTWSIARDEAAHMACGPSGTQGTDWWSASANEKAEFGVYDNTLTFGTDYSYVFDPGVSGTVYVNTGCSLWSDLNGGSDFQVPAEKQETTFAFSVDGDDIYLTLPAKTYFPYIPFDASYNNPTFKITSLTTKQMVLVADDGNTAWQFILSSGTATAAAKGYDANSEYNLWKSANASCGLIYYAPGWSQIGDFEYSVDNASNMYKVSLTEATTDQWQAQFHLSTDLDNTIVPTGATYDFSCILQSSKDISGVTVKLTEDGNDNNFYFAERVDLKAYEDKVFHMSEMEGIDLEGKNLKLVFDFGGNAESTDISIREIVLIDHSKNDIVLADEADEDVPAADVTWCDVNSAENIWASATYDMFYYYAPGWSPIADPTLTQNGNAYTISLPEATTDQWQAQVAFKTTNVSTSSDKNYDFKAVLTSNVDLKGVTVKLVLNGDDNTFYFADRIDLTAYEEYVYTNVNMPGIDMDLVNLFFDFGGNPANAEITVSDIILQEHNGPKVVNWDASSADNMWNSMTYNMFYYYAPGWSPIADPTLTQNGNAYTISLPEATTDQWQAQVAFKTDMSTSASNNYDFHVVLNSSKDISGVTVKLVLDGDDNTFYFADRIDLVAYEDYVYTNVDMAGIDMSKVNLFFDFGGNQAGTEVTLSDIILKVSE